MTALLLHLLKDHEKNRREKIFSLMGECSPVAFAKS